MSLFNVFTGATSRSWMLSCFKYQTRKYNVRSNNGKKGYDLINSNVTFCVCAILTHKMKSLSLFSVANRVEHILPEAYFRLSGKPSSQLVSNLIRRYHHSSNSEVIYAFDQGRLETVQLVLFTGLLPFSLQAVLRIPDRHTVQESWDPVLGVWVSQAVVSHNTSFIF